jgi:NodT family efflux transporter outer membrane factor (OMF) lipoprotein
MNNNNVKKIHMQILLMFAWWSLVLVGCAVGPDFESPKPPETQSYTELPTPEKTVKSKGPGGETQYFMSGADIPAEWWHLFHSKCLNELIERGLKNSPNLQAAQAALRQAEQNLSVSVASLFPFISAQPSLARERFSTDIFGLTNAPPLTFNLYNATVNVSYTLDVFGAIRRQIEVSEAQLDYQNFELVATYLTLTSNIVTAAITEASLRGQINATKELIASEEKQLALVEKKLNLGAISRLDVLAQQSLLDQMRATLPPLINQLSQTRHALAVLVGELPSESHLPEFNLEDLELPSELPVSLPSSLVQQRPDVKAAEALLHVASAQIGIATANMLPQFNFTGSYGWITNEVQSFFDPRHNVWNIIGTLVQPIFQGGALLGKKRAAVAAFEQAFAQYRQTVLQAFQNVADTLRALEIDAHQLQIQTDAEASARATLSLTQVQYNVGAVGYLNLLNAESQYQQARIGRIRAQATRYADTAALFQSLGGGWWNREPTCAFPENTTTTGGL